MKEWSLEVWGDYACFTRPEMKVERVSYDIMTPSAARAIFEAILWKPAIKWHITRLEVLSPIRWISVRRNEVSSICTIPTQAHLDGSNHKPMGFSIEDTRQQRAGLFLRDVHYRIYAWFEFISPAKRNNIHPLNREYWADNEEQINFYRDDESEAKYAAIFSRRARKGQCFHRPYLGCREFACNFRLEDETQRGKKPIDITDDLGWMLYDMDFKNPSDPKPIFFRARLVNGSINMDKRDSTLEVRG